MIRKDEVKQVWDEAAEAWADFVRTGKDYFRGYLNNPAVFKLIGNIRGKRVLDLACGEGRNTRILAQKGTTVTGIDLSPAMIKLAEQKEAKECLGITYVVGDAAELNDFHDGSFDLVTCFMALQDIEHMEKAVAEVFRVLKPKGRFIFSIPHPCFELVIKNGQPIRAYTDYFENVKFEINWNMERLSKHFKSISFHRTLTDYSQALHKAGFQVSKLTEPKPSPKALKEFPEQFTEHLKRPQSIIVESRKPGKKAKEP
jgi:ubiquinone/menaquinone biosynthesis C-methylase UbiE